MRTTRPLTIDDAPALASLLSDNREFLAPWLPQRGEEWFTADGQRRVVAALLAQQEAGLAVPLVVQDDGAGVVGSITLQSIVRGAFQSGSVGYLLAESAQGRGLATAALREAVELAFGALRLHRVQAETLSENPRSRRVLERVGFTEYGRAESYLCIAGRWREHVLHQLLTPTPERVDVG